MDDTRTTPYHGDVEPDQCALYGLWRDFFALGGDHRDEGGLACPACGANDVRAVEVPDGGG